MKKNECPCIGCEERTADCHGKCEKYKSWCETRRKQNEMVNEERNKERVYMGFKAESKKRMQRFTKKK